MELLKAQFAVADARSERTKERKTYCSTETEGPLVSDSCVPTHDFEESFRLAHADGFLKAQLIKHVNSDALLSAPSSDLFDVTSQIANLALKAARERYAERPERLRCVIAASPIPNALAVWGSFDWIVLTEGLLARLRGSVEECADRLWGQFSETLKSRFGARVLSITPPQGFETSLGALLYVSAIGFFVGHEAGHHLEGHDGYYQNQSHAEVFTDSNFGARASVLTGHALEFQADRYGALMSWLTLMEYILHRLDLSNFDKSEARQCCRVRALVASAGAFMALEIIQPRAIDWSTAQDSTHPPAVLRAVGISQAVSEMLKRVGRLTEAERKWTRLMTLELAARGTIVPKSKQESIFHERGGRHEPAALRATGIRAALHDPEVPRYILKMTKSLDALTPTLSPRKKEPRTP